MFKLPRTIQPVHTHGQLLSGMGIEEICMSSRRAVLGKHHHLEALLKLGAYSQGFPSEKCVALLCYGTSQKVSLVPNYHLLTSLSHSHGKLGSSIVQHFLLHRPGINPQSRMIARECCIGSGQGTRFTFFSRAIVPCFVLVWFA